jgi:hypothetical protein
MLVFYLGIASQGGVFWEGKEFSMKGELDSSALFENDQKLN